MLKHIFIYLCIATFLCANERSLHLAHDDVLRSQSRDLLSGEHYILKTFPGDHLVSVYITEDKMSVYSIDKIHTLCAVSAEKNNVKIEVQHLTAKPKGISYSINIAKNEITLAGNKQIQASVLRYASVLTDIENKKKFLLKIAMPLNEIAKSVFPKEQRDYTKLKRNWTMVKTNGDNSIYLDSGGLKIVDYGVFITSKAKNVALARVKGSVVNNTLLKISAVQITYHGGDYWIKGQATLVCQKN
ncbi:hypothetical protein [Candidatus Uabimicrobium amorphum]|uniref:Uncharacterized protein n=1 Tax=Uabimicrobium amorphum TaxID=2596890 RepID=A0A5S9ILL8_UABAM|nr:hypothetical protein [Candidatus Uabimicrobium amorphum]BBM84143.1 hypothetical protein UABAM_02499 [Candidatus Uabimicrobium amorphum]